MNAPNLSRRLASRIVEGLKGRGRILVVKGGNAALVRVVDDAMVGSIESVAERLGRAPASLNEASTTEALARISGRVADALLASEHLEDVFADRSVVEREVLDATRAVLREATEARDEALVRVELDLLGYVAATAGKRASTETIVQALERAGRSARATVDAYDAQAREALFLPEPPAHPDLRLELEEAVADELCALVQRGEVELPMIDRTASLSREAIEGERARLTRSIDRAATRTLRRTGCRAKWAFSSGTSLHVTFTPLSEQDARDVDAYVGAFVREVDAILAEAGAPPAGKGEPPPTETPVVTPQAPAEAATEMQRAPEPREEHGNGEARAEPEAEPAPESEAEPTAKRTTRARQERKAATKRASRTPSRPSTARAATTKRAAPQKRPAAKRTTKKATSEEAPRAKKTAATKRSRTPTPTTKARAAKKR